MKKYTFLVFLLSIVFSFNIFAAEQYGILMVVKGDVKIQNAKATVNARIGGKVFPGDTVVTGADSRAKIVMSDRNVINVSPDTKIEITKYTNDSQSGAKEVELKLDKGKVRNNVEQAYDGTKSKFMMKTPTAVAGVRGTQFVTSFDPQSMKTEVTALRGQVAFSSMSNGKPVGPPVVVSKGESASAAAGAAPTPPKPVSQNQMKEMDRDTSGMQPKKEGQESSSPGQNNPGAKPADQGKGDGKGPGGPMLGSSGETRMLDNRDLNPGMARDMAPPPPPPVGYMPGPRPPMGPPPVNGIIRDAIRDNIGHTWLIVRPQ